MVFTCTYTILLYIMHLELFGTVTVLFLIAVGQWRHRTNHPGLASLYKLLQGLSHQVSSIREIPIILIPSDRQIMAVPIFRSSDPRFSANFAALVEMQQGTRVLYS